MTTPASMSELSTTAASNNPAGSDAPSTIDDQIRALAAIVRQNVTKGSDIASASAITIPASGNYFVVTGTTGITSITDTNSWYGREVVLKFSGALTITHSANLILPGAANITTVEGDVAKFVSESSGVWRCSEYTKYSAQYATLGANTFTGLQQLAYSSDIASAATVDLGTATGNSVTVTHSSGTTAITSFGGASLQKGTLVLVTPSISGGTLTVTHHATNMILLGGVDITLASGDVLLMMKNSDSNAEWKHVGGWRADGAPWGVTAVTPGSYTAAAITVDAYGRLTAAASGSGGITLGAFTAWTSGAYKDITGLPAGAKRITISPKGLSTTGSSNLLIQIGDETGGLKTSGYASGCTNDGATRVTSTAGMIVTSAQVASESRTGTVVLTLVDESANTWVSSGQLTGADGINANSGGQVTLSGPLDRFRFTTVGGTNTGDAGGFGYTVEF